MLILNDHEFNRIVSFIQENYGINLSKKRALIQSRLALDVQRRGYPTFKAYFDEVISHPVGLECQHMIDKLSTNHTYFFREPRCFTHMCDTAIPELLQNGVRHINIWCAAAAAGQECYSIAMMLDDSLALKYGVSYHILGSDINSEVLKQAQTGIYPKKELENIPLSFRKRYCRSYDDDHFEIVSTLKERITWKQINLVKPLSSMSSFHLIFCRNVMIYFHPDAKEALTWELYRLVCEDGYVYVGSTETLDMKRARFNYLGPSIFKKRKEAI